MKKQTIEYKIIDQVVELAAEITRPHLPSLSKEELEFFLHRMVGNLEIKTPLAEMPQLLALRLHDMAEDLTVDAEGLTVGDLVDKINRSEPVDPAKITHPAGKLMLRLLKLNPQEAAALYFAAHAVVGVYDYSDDCILLDGKDINDYFTVIH